MPSRVLILQSDPAAAQSLLEYFSKRGDRVLHTADASEALALLKAEKPDIVLFDLHLPGSSWFELLSSISQQRQKTRVIITHKYPDYRRELQAKERGVIVFLRAPFTPARIEKALQTIDRKEAPTSAGGYSGALPRVRLPMRLKITLPYALLALIFAFASAFLISRYILESLQDRFTAQLIDVGKL